MLSIEKCLVVPICIAMCAFSDHGCSSVLICVALGPVFLRSYNGIVTL